MTLCGADYHKRVRDIECVAALEKLDGRDRVWCAQIPILNNARGVERQRSAKKPNEGYLDGFIPRACDKNTSLGCLEPFDNLDGRVVLGDLLCLPSLNVEETRSIVTTSRYNFVSLL